MKKYFYIILFLFSPLMLAASLFPAACRISGLRYSHQTVSLFAQHTAKPRLYAIHNISKKTIWLTHDKRNPGAGAGWDSRLQPNHWSVILVTARRFKLQCAAVPCEQVISVCQFSEFRSQHPIDGGYWVVENVPFHVLLSKMHARGFTFKLS